MEREDFIDGFVIEVDNVISNFKATPEIPISKIEEEEFLTALVLDSLKENFKEFLKDKTKEEVETIIDEALTKWSNNNIGCYNPNL